MPEPTALSFYQLIGAPLHALVEAETYSAEATASFIERVGFEKVDKDDPQKGSENLGNLRTLTFRQERRTAGGEAASYRVEVPLLSILPIPALQIQDAELEFLVKIVDVISASEKGQADRAQGGAAPPSPEPETSPGKRLVPTPPRIDLKGMVGRSQAPDTRRGRAALDMQVRVKIKVAQADVPAGLARLFNLMEESISSTRLEETPPGGG